jgi:hypothetical protein
VELEVPVEPVDPGVEVPPKSDLFCDMSLSPSIEIQFDRNLAKDAFRVKCNCCGANNVPGWCGERESEWLKNSPQLLGRAKNLVVKGYKKLKE